MSVPGLLHHITRPYTNEYYSKGMVQASEDRRVQCVEIGISDTEGVVSHIWYKSGSFRADVKNGEIVGRQVGSAEEN